MILLAHSGILPCRIYPHKYLMISHLGKIVAAMREPFRSGQSRPTSVTLIPYISPAALEGDGP